MAVCPECGGPEGVQLLTSIAPCERCYAKGRPVQVQVPASYGWRNVRIMTAPEPLKFGLSDLSRDLQEEVVFHQVAQRLLGTSAAELGRVLRQEEERFAAYGLDVEISAEREPEWSRHVDRNGSSVLCRNADRVTHLSVNVRGPICAPGPRFGKIP